MAAPSNEPLSLGEQALAAAKERDETRARKVWLHAWYDPVANLKAHTGCVRLADLYGDNDSKLLVAGADRKLKVYKGTVLLSENVLLDAPVAICAFYPEAKKPNLPSVAVAAGPFVFIYRNMRPYYKFTLPYLAVDKRESAAWAAQEANTDSDNGTDQLRDVLVAARDAGAQLSSRSQVRHTSLRLEAYIGPAHPALTNRAQPA